MKKGDKARFRGGERALTVLSAPRLIAGGCVVQVTWADRRDVPSCAIFPDGSVHPAHLPGFTWEEPTANLVVVP